MGRRRAAAAAEEALAVVGMTEHMGRPIRGYSKGMRQRTKLAQALVHEPRVLFLDEPFTGTDPVARRDLLEVIRGLGEAGHSVVVSSHVLHEVEALTPNVILLHRGRLVAEGQVRQIRDLIDQHPHRIVLVCDDYRALAAKLVRWEDVEGVKMLPRRQGRAGRDAPSRRLLCPPAGAVAGGRDGAARGLFGGRQPGSRVQVPGEQMKLSADRCPLPIAVVLSRRPDLRAALAALFVLTLRQHLRGRRLLVLSLLFALPSVLAVGGRPDVARHAARREPGVRLRCFNLIPHALAPLAALLYAAGIIQRRRRGADADLPAPAAAAALGAVSGQAAGDAAGHLGADGGVHHGHVGDHRPDGQRAGDRGTARAGAEDWPDSWRWPQVGYCGLFGLLGLLMRHSLLVGVAYIVLLEGLLASFDTVARRLTVMYYFRVLALRWLEPASGKRLVDRPGDGAGRRRPAF